MGVQIMARLDVFAQCHLSTKSGCHWTSILWHGINVFSKLNLVVNRRFDYGQLKTSILN